MVDFTAGAGSFTNLELVSSTTPGTGYDQIVASGNVVLNATSTINLSLSYVPGPGSVFRVIDNTGGNAISGEFGNLADNATIFLGGFPF